MSPERLLAPGRIGPVDVANRIVRAGTSECMATPTGAITDRYLQLYATLARNRVGLIFTGHMYCLCLMHDGYHSLRCWRTPRHRLIHHALFRLLGGFRHGPGTQPAAPGEA